jgi:hypothetical protein
VATFIVVVILSLPILLKWSRHFLWLALPIGAVLIALLVGTGSRGGVLALVCGLLVGIIVGSRSGWRPNDWKTGAVVGLMVVLGVGAGLFIFPKGFRLGAIDISPEASAGRRLEVWSAVPAMVAAAPGGWGAGNAAEAYEQWFEPIGETVALKHLLSSHLTWLVEFDWPLRWLYLLFWIAAILIVLPDQRFRFPVWGVAVWTAFMVALFYNAAGKWWNWPLPSLWLLCAIIFRWRQRTFPTARYWIAPVLIAGLIVELPFAIALLHPPGIPVHSLDDGNVVVVGTGSPTTAILGPSKDVLGDFYGQEIRQKGSKNGATVVVSRPDDVAARYVADCRLFVVSGGDEMALSKWRSVFPSSSKAVLVLINCRVPVDDSVRNFKQTVYCQGAFYGNPHLEEWKARSAIDPTVIVKEIPGQEAYISDWWPLLSVAPEK